MARSIPRSPDLADEDDTSESIREQGAGMDTVLDRPAF